MANSTLALSTVADVVINISAVAPATPTFNQGLIIGSSGRIPSIGANSRLRLYTTTAAMLTDGFMITDPEYLAAQAYFGQIPAPQYLWIGTQDATSVKTIAIHSGNAGTNYAQGDIVAIAHSSASGATATVATVTSGVPQTVTLTTGGTGYPVSSANTTTAITGTGSGLEIDISAVGETAVQALAACRLASAAWYIGTVQGAAKADHEAIAAYIQAATPASDYFYWTSDSDVLTSVTTDVGSMLMAGAYSRCTGFYATTQSGAFPGNAYIAAAAMGKALGLNTGLANSYFTMKFKTLIGITAEPLTATQVTTIEGKNLNIYVNYANTSAFTWLEQGVQSDGQFFDEVLALDMLSSDIQFSVIDEFIANPSIPLDNSGQSIMLSTVSAACQRSVVRGFIAPGTWEGQTVLNVTQGTALPQGFLVFSQSFTLQSSGDRAARKGMPVYVLLAEAGAMHSIVISVQVQR